MSTPQQTAAALSRDGYDLPDLLGSVWRDQVVQPGDLVRVVAASPTVSGWQVRLIRWQDGQPEPDTVVGTLFLDSLIQGYTRQAST